MFFFSMVESEEGGVLQLHIFLLLIRILLLYLLFHLQCVYHNSSVKVRDQLSGFMSLSLNHVSLWDSIKVANVCLTQPPR